jgi:thiamine biosynthesis lipoprotein
MRLWGFHDKKPHRPTAAELEAVRPLIGYRNVTLDAKTRSVHFARAGVELDLGGIAKGFAVELAANVLKSAGLGGAIDAGGNQYFVGTPPGKSAWSVGIEHPERRGELLGTIDVKAGSLSTSGGYSNFLVIEGTRYGHILDPQTLQPCPPVVLSVTVVAEDGTLADALSKPPFVLGAERGLRLIESFPGAAAVIAYRKSDGTLGLLVSAALRTAFHGAAAR